MYKRRSFRSVKPSKSIDLDDKLLLDKYEKGLEKILERGEKEYYSHALDLNRHQLVVSRIFLWVLVIITSTCLYSVNFLLDYTNGLLSQTLEVENAISIVMIILSIIVILCGYLFYKVINSTSNKPYGQLYQKNWVEYERGILSDYNKSNKFLYSNSLSYQITNLNGALNTAKAATKNKANELRQVTITIMISIFLYAILLAIFLFTYNPEGTKHMFNITKAEQEQPRQPDDQTQTPDGFRTNDDDRPRETK